MGNTDFTVNALLSYVFKNHNQFALQAKLIRVALEAALSKLKTHFQGEVLMLFAAKLWDVGLQGTAVIPLASVHAR